MQHVHTPHLRGGGRLYLSNLQNVFVQIAKYICPNCQIYLSKLPIYIFLNEKNVFFKQKYICPNNKINLFKLQNICVHSAKHICPNSKMYLLKLHNIFVQIAKLICLDYKIYLSKSQNILGVCTCQLLHNLPYATYSHNNPHFRE